jgi:hypothetical protein
VVEVVIASRLVVLLHLQMLGSDRVRALLIRTKRLMKNSIIRTQAEKKNYLRDVTDRERGVSCSTMNKRKFKIIKTKKLNIDQKKKMFIQKT